MPIRVLLLELKICEIQPPQLALHSPTNSIVNSVSLMVPRRGRADFSAGVSRVGGGLAVEHGPAAVHAVGGCGRRLALLLLALAARHDLEVAEAVVGGLHAAAAMELIDVVVVVDLLLLPSAAPGLLIALLSLLGGGRRGGGRGHGEIHNGAVLSTKKGFLLVRNDPGSGFAF